MDPQLPRPLFLVSMLRVFSDAMPEVIACGVFFSGVLQIGDRFAGRQGYNAFCSYIRCDYDNMATSLIFSPPQFTTDMLRGFSDAMPENVMHDGPPLEIHLTASLGPDNNSTFCCYSQCGLRYTEGVLKTSSSDRVLRGFPSIL